MLAIATASLASLAEPDPSVDAWTTSSQLLARGSAADAGSSPTPRPMLTATIEELRGGDAASRSKVRPTQPAPTPTIVGTFAPLADCTATVPTEAPPNGRLSADELCSIGDGQELRADAAATYVAMNASYAATFGSNICITDSYRSFGSQQSLYWRKPSLAAVPGTSNHGWGVAVDLFCGVDDPSSAEHTWLDEHGDEYGWFNPGWAQPTGSRPEPWHWEFDPSLLG